jgi:hypothetical protein
MNLPENIEDTGLWWNSKAPDQNCHGTLTVSRTGKISLELSNPPHSLMGNGNDIPIVHGQLKKKGQVSLFGITIMGDSFANRIQTRTFLIDSLLVGQHLHSRIDEPVFIETEIEIEGLYEWVDFPKIPLERNIEKNVVEIVSGNIEPKRFKISDDLSLSIKQDRHFHFSSGGSILTIECTAAIGLTWMKPKSLLEIQNIIYRINSFLCLALDNPLSLTSVKVSKPGGNTDQKETMAIIYQSIPEKTEKSAFFHPSWFLFSYKMIENDFEKILSSYLADSELKIAYDLYFSATAFKHNLLETRFLLLVQGLEFFHRLTHECKKFPDKRFEELKRNIISHCENEDETKLVNDSLAYANECSLRMRLKLILDSLPSIIPDKKQFIEDLVETRNYYTHFDPSKKKKAKFGFDLWVLSTRTEALFSLCILENLGFSEDQIQKVRACKTIKLSLS